MLRVLALLILLATCVPARAVDGVSRDEFARTIYLGMADRIRREYDMALLTVPHRGSAAAQADELRQALKVLYYNKAALFAFCAADAEQIRNASTPRVPAEHNVALTTCVEQKFAELNDFTNKLTYAGIFFPERIVRCGEASRLPEREQLLPPYQFLQLAKPRLYDFVRYNQCLMTSD